MDKRRRDTVREVGQVLGGREPDPWDTPIFNHATREREATLEGVLGNMEQVRYLWETRHGDTVELDHDIVACLARVADAFPGARAAWWRRSGWRWERP
jgi:hypothetical protein